MKRSIKQDGQERSCPFAYTNAAYTDSELQTGSWVREISAASLRGWHAFYHTTVWRKKRASILKRDGHACCLCKAKGIYTKATTVHHIRHLKECPELALSDDNLQSLCSECHEKAHPEKFFKKTGFENPERW